MASIKQENHVAYATQKDNLLENNARIDLRVKRTRHYIREAFFELIREKGFEAVTIQDITERAMINRSTFYRHFQDKYDLARKSLDESFAMMLEQLDASDQIKNLPEGQPPRNFHILLAHIEQNADLYRLLFGKNGISIFTSRFREYILEVLHFRLQNVTQPYWKNEIPLAMFEEYLAGAYLGVIQWWLDNMSEHPSQKVAYWIYQLVVHGTISAMNLGEEKDPAN